MPNQTFPTALTVLPTYGIQLLTHDLYYYHEPNLTELALEDVILHTLLIDPESQTYSTYALLLALKNKRIIDMNLLLEKSRKYKIVDLARNLVKYIESNGRIREWPLPDPNELQEQTDLYGVRMG